MKLTKAEWDEFWAALGPDWYMEECDVDPEDDSGLKPEELISFSDGMLCWQGDGEAKEVPGIFTLAQVRKAKEERFGFGYDMAAAIRRWRKSKTTMVVSVEIPKDLEQALRLFVKNNGGRVVS